jgi:copper chaperone
MGIKALKIDGMSCSHCVKAVTMALQELPGVDVTDVAVGQATIEADDDVVTEAQLAQAIEDAGFTLVQASPA